jgi:uncharacterized protein YegP (UPF0339 family)
VGEERDKFVCRDVEGGYRWRLGDNAGETLGASSQGHRDKHSCYEEIRAVMGEHPDADILDVSVD